MRDADVRRALLEQLRAEHSPADTLIVEELGLCQGSTRVDVAVINGELSGYEIKSASDTLVRFPRQQQLYSQILDRAWIVACDERLQELEATLPSWWGMIAIVSATTDGLELCVRRESSVNPCIDAAALAELLWRDEALALLSSRGVDRGVRTKGRRELWARVLEVYSLAELRDAVRAAIKARSTWRTGRRPSRGGAKYPDGARFLGSLVSSDQPRTEQCTDRRD